MSPPDGDGPAADAPDDLADVPAEEPATGATEESATGPAAGPQSPDGDPSTVIRRTERRLVRLERRTGLDRVVLGLLAIAALGLVLRFVGLGARVAHWDEARVLYWVSHYQETGHFAYRRIIHGPFIQLVNQQLFSLFGPSDWLARAPVALVGGLVPLSALLFRRHLDDLETLLLGLLLAVNPVLVYYSRFMRSDLLVAAFMFVGFGFVVRYYDTRRVSSLYAAVVFVALGFGAKENAIVYVLTWVGATALLADQALYRPRGALRNGLDVLRRAAANAWAGLSAGPRSPRENVGVSVLVGLGHVLGLGLVGLATFVLLYAQRGAGLDGVIASGQVVEDTTVGLWEAVGNPLLLPQLVGETVSYTADAFAQWFGHTGDPGCGKSSLVEGYTCFLGRFAEVLVSAAGALTVFAVIGTIRERYARSTSRNLVLFFAYAGFVSIIGYPLGTDIFGAWLTIHAVVPLAVPAAAGVGIFVRWAGRAAATADLQGMAVSGAVVLLAAAFVGQALLTGVYLQPTSADNELVQYAQPRDDVRESLGALDGVPPAAENPDVVLYGNYFVDGDESSAWEPACAKWFNSLPLPWYLQRYDATAACASNPEELSALLTGEPPIIVMRGGAASEWRTTLDTYEANAYFLRRTDTNTVIFVREDYANGTAPGQRRQAATLDHPRFSPPTG
jgi:uncharacterized protein (TIGR03663 family)